MTPCDCELSPHCRRTVVLTGGPGAGKTAVLELVRRQFCEHVVVVPESASIVFGGGFPRGRTLPARHGAQRAIFHVQRELETVLAADDDIAVLLCDRGTIDGAAYWPGAPEAFWAEVGTTREAELARYDVVIHLRVPDAEHGYGHSNGLRVETAAEARVIDDAIAQAWRGHPRVLTVPSMTSFMEKARAAIELVRSELPDCRCRRDVVG